MKHIFITTVALALFLSGCTAPTNFNIKNSSIPSNGDRALSTYADYGSEVDYNKEEKIHQLSIFTGGNAGCDNGALAYAKPKLDKFMKTNKYSSYTVIKGQFSLIPLSKCELYIRFEK